MGKHWETVVKPLLIAVMARVLVEVGIAQGGTTRRMAEWAVANGGVLHGIDPKPKMDVGAFEEQYGGHFIFHREMSLEALPRIRDADFVLLDGDHNWYTVHRELHAIARVAREEGRPFPLTALHDVDWPYGRRDMYHNPSSVPAEHRQEHAVGGVVPGRSELAEGQGQGLNSLMHNAVVEGTPHNGVRTAVEDFMSETDFELNWSSVPGFFGCGILLDEHVLARTPALRETLDSFRTVEFLEAQCREVEIGRLNILARLQELRLKARHFQQAAPASEPADGTPGR
jgi:Methyltransferase domain